MNRARQTIMDATRRSRWAMAGMFLVASTALAAEAKLGSFADVDAKAKAGDRLNVVFFGASLTWGANASDPAETSYRAVMRDRFEQHYPAAHFRFRDSAIGGTGSQLGAFRLDRDVLAHRPDLVFVDFTANDDIDSADPETLASYESILRRLATAGIPVVQVAFPFRWDIDTAKLPNMKRLAAHRALADTYGNGWGDAVGGKDMFCLDAATGAEIWKLPSVGNDLCSSPTIAGGVLVVSTGTLKGFDPATGKELWACPQAGTGNGPNTSPGVWVTDKGPLIITNMGNLTCVNPKDGSVVWRSEKANCNSTPAVVGDICIVGSPVAGYRLLPDKAEKLFGSSLWDQGASHLIYNDHVFTYTRGELRCLDLTGKELWAQGVGGEISSPVLADGKIFAVCGDDKLVMTDATTAKPAKF